MINGKPTFYLFLVLGGSVFAALQLIPENKESKLADPEEEELENYVERTVDDGFDQLESEVERARDAFDKSLQSAQTQMQKQVKSVAHDFSDSMITRYNVGKLAFLMARDYVDDDGRADVWFEKHLAQRLQPHLRRYQESVSQAVAVFEADMNDAIEQFNSHTHASRAHELDDIVDNIFPGEIAAKIKAILEKQSMKDTMFVGSIVAFDSYVIMRSVGEIKSTLLASMYTILRPVATRMAARIGTTASVSWVPGLNITAGVLGTAWTGWDVYKIKEKARQSFLNELDASLNKQREVLNREVRGPVHEHANQIIEEWQANRDRIVEQLLERHP